MAERSGLNVIGDILNNYVAAKQGRPMPSTHRSRALEEEERRRFAQKMQLEQQQEKREQERLEMEQQRHSLEKAGQVGQLFARSVELVHGMSAAGQGDTEKRRALEPILGPISNVMPGAVDLALNAGNIPKLEESLVGEYKLRFQACKLQVANGLDGYGKCVEQVAKDMGTKIKNRTTFSAWDMDTGKPVTAMEQVTIKNNKETTEVLVRDPSQDNRWVRAGNIVSVVPQLDGANLTADQEQEIRQLFSDAVGGLGMLDRLSEQLLTASEGGDSILGMSGFLSQFTAMVVEQSDEVIKRVMGQDSTFRLDASDPYDKPATFDPTGNTYQWDALDRTIDKMGVVGQERAALRSNILGVAYALARAADPGGRLSEADVQNQLNRLRRCNRRWPKCAARHSPTSQKRSSITRHRICWIETNLTLKGRSTSSNVI